VKGPLYCGVTKPELLQFQHRTKLRCRSFRIINV